MLRRERFYSGTLSNKWSSWQGYALCHLSHVMQKQALGSLSYQACFLCYTNYRILLRFLDRLYCILQPVMTKIFRHVLAWRGSFVSFPLSSSLPVLIRGNTWKWHPSWLPSTITHLDLRNAAFKLNGEILIYFGHELGQMLDVDLVDSN